MVMAILLKVTVKIPNNLSGIKRLYLNNRLK
jgi:hypothetical protein